MNESTPLPEGDADALLARRIGRGEAPSDENAFERALGSYRDRSGLITPSSGFSNRLWGRIASTTRPEASPLRLVPAWARWASAAAAICLIAYAFWGVFNHGPALVSSSGNAIATVTLEDGSVVTLRPHSKLFKRATNDYLLEGEALFDVTQNPGRLFRAGGGLGEVQVLGTRFDLSTWGNETAVYLESGRVAFRHLVTGAVDTLDPGDALVASATGTHVSAKKLAPDVALDWVRGVLIFGERPIWRIAAELEQHFAISVLIPDSLKTQTLSGQILLADPDQSLHDLATALGARFEQPKPHVYRLVVK